MKSEFVLQLTTYKKNPFVYGENSRWINTPVMAMAVTDKTTGKPPQPALFSDNSHAMSSTLKTKLRDSSVIKYTVKRDEIPPQGKLHAIIIDQVRMSLTVTYDQGFNGPMTLYAQMDVQPGTTDYDFTVATSSAGVKVTETGYWKVKATAVGAKLKIFIYGISIRKTGKLKLLVLVDSAGSRIHSLRNLKYIFV